MTPTRNSSATEPNKRLKDTAADRSTAESLSTAGPAAHQTSNIRWLQDAGLTEGIVLLGGTSVAHFRVRNAQAQLRNDLTPSYWSLAGILVDGGRFADDLRSSSDGQHQEGCDCHAQALHSHR